MSLVIRAELKPKCQRPECSVCRLYRTVLDQERSNAPAPRASAIIPRASSIAEALLAMTG